MSESLEAELRVVRAREYVRGPLRAGLRRGLAPLACVLLLTFGWLMRDEGYLRPGSGLGYGLGIAGGVAMLVMLLYSARKRLRSWENLGPIQYWFKAHMVLGILGPIAVLFHSNFHLGSLNSRAALFSTLAVAGSGVLGRFVYERVYQGFQRRRSEMSTARASAELMLGWDLELDREKVQAQLVLKPFPDVIARLQEFEEHESAPTRGYMHAICRFVIAGHRAGRVLRLCLRELPHDTVKERAAVRHWVDAVRTVAQFAGYERLFRLWHAFHVPLFLILVLTALGHVVAVHMY